jgi:hypothetical protein
MQPAVVAAAAGEVDTAAAVTASQNTQRHRLLHLPAAAAAARTRRGVDSRWRDRVRVPLPVQLAAKLAGQLETIRSALRSSAVPLPATATASGDPLHLNHTKFKTGLQHTKIDRG